MKKISMFALVLGLVVLVTACGSGSAPAPQATPTSPPEATPTSPPAPTPTSAEVPAPASASGEVPVIELTQDADGFKPSEIRVQAGSQVRFIITNTDTELHDMYDRASRFEVELKGGETKTYDWTAPQEKGTYTAECSFHGGQILTIIVR